MQGVFLTGLHFDHTRLSENCLKHLLPSGFVALMKMGKFLSVYIYK